MSLFGELTRGVFITSVYNFGEHIAMHDRHTYSSWMQIILGRLASRCSECCLVRVTEWPFVAYCPIHRVCCLMSNDALLSGDGWTGMLLEMIEDGVHKMCVPHLYQIANKFVTGRVGALFFITFSLLCEFIVLNILIAVILLHFQDAASGDGILALKSLASVSTKAARIKAAFATDISQ